MTHFEYAKSKGIETCTAHHMTFEGRCLNCDYDPAKHGDGHTRGMLGMVAYIKKQQDKVTP